MRFSYFLPSDFSTSFVVRSFTDWLTSDWFTLSNFEPNWSHNCHFIKYLLFTDRCRRQNFLPSLLFLFFRTLSLLYLPVHNFWMLLCPSSLSYDWQMGSLPLITSVWDDLPRVVLALPLFYGTLLAGFMTIFYRNKSVSCLLTQTFCEGRLVMILAVSLWRYYFFRQ